MKTKDGWRAMRLESTHGPEAGGLREAEGCAHAGLA